MVISRKKRGKEKSKSRLGWINQSTWALQLLNLVKQKCMSFDICTWKKNMMIRVNWTLLIVIVWFIIWTSKISIAITKMMRRKKFNISSYEAEIPLAIEEKLSIKYFVDWLVEMDWWVNLLAQNNLSGKKRQWLRKKKSKTMNSV